MLADAMSPENEQQSQSQSQFQGPEPPRKSELDDPHIRSVLLKVGRALENRRRHRVRREQRRERWQQQQQQQQEQQQQQQQQQQQTPQQVQMHEQDQALDQGQQSPGVRDQDARATADIEPAACTRTQTETQSEEEATSAAGEGLRVGVHDSKEDGRRLSEAGQEKERAVEADEADDDSDEEDDEGEEEEAAGEGSRRTDFSRALSLRTATERRRARQRELLRSKSGNRAASASVHREERARRPAAGRIPRSSSARAAARSQSAASNSSFSSSFAAHDFHFQAREDGAPAASEPSAATRRLQAVLAARRGQGSSGPGVITDLEARTGTRARLRAFLDGKPLPDISSLAPGLSSSSSSRPQAVEGLEGESPLWRSLRAQIRNAARSEAPTSGSLAFLNQHRPQQPQQPATEEEAEEYRERVAAARLTLELLEARRIAEAASAPTGSRRMRQKKNRRSLVDRKCDLHYTIAKLDEEFAAQERSARYYNNIQVQAAKPPKAVPEEEPAPQQEDVSD